MAKQPTTKQLAARHAFTAAAKARTAKKLLKPNTVPDSDKDIAGMPEEAYGLRRRKKIA